MQTIDSDSALRILYPFEIDKMAPRYKTENGIYTFTSPSMYSIEKNYFFLLRNSVVKQFEQKYIYKPSYMSYDEYGVVNLDLLLMYVNGISCAEEFNLETVIVPIMSAVVDMCQDKFPEKQISELEKIAW
jgi:hypothetical protein